MRTKIIQKSFSRLTKAEKKVAIAKDVIEQIKIKTYKAATGRYVRVIFKSYSDNFDKYLEEKSCELNTLIGDKKVACDCCALGSMVLSHVNKTDNLQAENWHDINDQDNIKQRLSKIFSSHELDMIETVFEKRVINNNNTKLAFEDSCSKWHNTDFGKQLIKYGRSLGNPTNRLIAIMKNIVRNKGNFTLPCKFKSTKK